MEMHFRHGDAEIREPYHYTECGLNFVYLVNGYETAEYQGETYHSVHNVEQLHKVIANFLVKERKALSGDEIRFLRKEMNLTQDELANLMRTTGQTVARWEKNACAIPGPAEMLLRAFYICHVEGAIDVEDMAEALAEVDEHLADAATFSFEEGGWRDVA